MTDVWLDIVLAVRRLRGSPLFTLFAILTLGLGIGATTAIYAAVYTLLWQAPDIVHLEQMVDVTQRGMPNTRPVISWTDFRELRRSQHESFSGLAAWRPSSWALQGAAVVETVNGDAVNGEYFATLGVTARVGRLIQVGDERDGASPVVVLSEGLWRRAFASDPDIVGQTIKIGGHPFELVGVARGFRGLERLVPSEVWIPITALPLLSRLTQSGEDLADPNGPHLAVKARLRPGVSAARAASGVVLLGRQLEQAFPTADQRLQRLWSVTPSDEADPLAGSSVSAMASLIIIAVCLVLAIACSNLANLSLAREASREHELAVRIALGATRWRLIRGHLVESTFVVLVGGMAAAVVARALIDSFSTRLQLGQGFSISFQPEISAAVVAMTAAAMVLCLLIFGAWPALQLTRPDPQAALKTGAATTPPRWLLHRRLVAWQVAGSVALLLVAAVCIRALATVALHGSVVDLDRLTVAEIDFRSNGQDDASARRTIDSILKMAADRHEFGAVAASVGLPIGMTAQAAAVTTTDHPFSAERDIGHAVFLIPATAGLLRTLGVPVLRGRTFNELDTGVAIVSATLARAIFQGSDAIGQTLLLGPSQRASARFPAEGVTVIGVASDTDAFENGRSRDVIYVPFNHSYAWIGSGLVTITARAIGNPGPAVATLRSTIRQVDPGLAVMAAGPGTTMLAGPYVILRVLAALAATLGALALMLAMTGLYGVLSRVVAGRTRELGVRMALGADRGRIIRMVLFDGCRPVLDGLALGLIAGVIARLIIRAVVVVPIPVIDPLTFSIVPIPIAVAAFLASYLPARRASRVEPNVALRHL